MKNPLIKFYLQYAGLIATSIILVFSGKYGEGAFSENPWVVLLFMGVRELGYSVAGFSTLLWGGITILGLGHRFGFNAPLHFWI